MARGYLYGAISLLDEVLQLLAQGVRAGESLARHDERLDDLAAHRIRRSTPAHSATASSLSNASSISGPATL